MTYVDPIIEKFGGVRKMAAAIDRPVSTVGSWSTRGSIPDDAKASVLKIAQSLGIDLDKSDFFPAAPGDAAAPSDPTDNKDAA
jgi:hypothetical protein